MTPSTPINRLRNLPTPTNTHQRESRDSLNIGKLVEGQMRAVIEIIKQKQLLKLPPPPPTGTKGIVISAGGKYADWGLVNARWTRDQGIALPIQVWHLGPHEIPPRYRKHFKALDVELVDAHEVRTRHWHRTLKGWSLKQYAAMWAPFQIVLSLDADAFITADPSPLIFDDPDFQKTPAFFCADIKNCRPSNWAYFYAQTPIPAQEMESGFFAWDRSDPRTWQAIQMTHWLAEHSEVWDKLLHGDKDRPYLAFNTLGTPYLFADQPQWLGWGIRHFWKGTAICDHGMGWKRGEHAAPDPRLPALFEWVRSLA